MDEPEERGMCPRCGLGEVTHLVFGLPDGPPEEPWVVFGGCIRGWGPLLDRRCDSCDHKWESRLGVSAHRESGDLLR